MFCNLLKWNVGVFIKALELLKRQAPALRPALNGLILEVAQMRKSTEMDVPGSLKNETKAINICSIIYTGAINPL